MIANPVAALTRQLAGLTGGAPDLSVLGMYRKLSAVPGGKHAFSRAVAFRAPYFATISPFIAELRPGYCEVRIQDRRSVRNHLGTVHAIAMCNAAEVAGGVMTEVSIPADHRWIPRGMTVEYLARARGELRAIAEVDPLPAFGEPADLPVPVEILDRENTCVVRATITMRVSPKPPAAGS